VTKDLELRLVAEFPDIFRDYGGDMRTTCMHWGFSHDDGWFDLVRAYCLKLEAVRRTTGIATISVSPASPRSFGTAYISGSRS